MDRRSFFSAGEFDAFREAVDGALSAFGADGQDVDDGQVSLAAGDPTVEVYEFSLEVVADRCRDTPREDWESVCFRVIDEWVNGTPQREWLAARSFHEIADQLQVWVSRKPPLTFQADSAAPPSRTQ